MSGLILQFAFQYTDANRERLNREATSMENLEHYLKTQNLVEQFATYGDKHGLQRRNLMIQKSHALLERYLHSRVIYNIMDEDAWIQYLNIDDPVIKQTLDLFRRNEAFPKKPTEEPGKKQKVAFENNKSFINREINKTYRVRS